MSLDHATGVASHEMVKPVLELSEAGVPAESSN